MCLLHSTDEQEAAAQKTEPPPPSPSQEAKGMMPHYGKIIVNISFF